ncbi:HNH endonuclease family protein [Azotobacter armeniacus]
MKTSSLALAFILSMVGQYVLADAPESFEKAKIALREKVYFDRQTSDVGDLYCGCRWKWMGRSGGRIDLESCGYEVRADSNRAQRIEWEHIVPAWVLGHQRQCWQKGGRENCKTSDLVFRLMEADMHNLSPTIGEVNADRSNYRYGMLPSTPAQYGACPTRTDFKQRVTEPRDAVKGLVARVQFYMHDRYGLSMSRQQQQLFMAWSRMYPVSAWERERDQRIAKVTGHHNPFVTGERTWTLGHKPSREGLAGQGTATPARRQVAQPVQVAEESGSAPVIGNSASKVYHLPVGCPSYEQVQEKNRVSFGSAADAEAAGFRRAGNCR